jgi:hypothetical protein
MSSILIPPRIQFIDKNGEPLVGGFVYLYEAGTSVPKQTWKNQTETSSNTHPVDLDDAGRAQIWFRGAAKFRLEDANHNFIYEDDNVISYTDVDFTGLTATIGDLNSTNTSGIVVTNNYPIQLVDRGKTILANAASTPITVTLLPVITATNRYRITIKKIDFSSNDVTITTNAAEEIDGRPQYILPDYGDFIEVLCDGSTWHLVAAQIRGTIITETLSFAVTLEDDGKFFNCNTNGGNVVVTLPAISTLGKGFEVGFKKIDNSLNSVIINPNGAETIDGQSSLEIDTQYLAFNIKADTLDWYIKNDFGAGITVTVPNKYIAGLTTSQVAPDPDHDIQIEPGVFADSTNVSLFELRTAIIKEINNTWAEGNLAGGLASPLTLAADTWYHVMVLAKQNGEVDAGFDTSLTATNLFADTAVQTAGYIYYRRVASIRTDGSSNIKDYHQTYDEFLWDNPDNYIQRTVTTTLGHEIFALDVPLGFRVKAFLNMEATSNAGNIYARPTFVSDLFSSTGGNPLATYDGTSTNTIFINTSIITDNAQQIKQTPGQTSGAVTYRLITLGWKDWRMD